MSHERQDFATPESVHAALRRASGVVTPDPLQERVARVLRDHMNGSIEEPIEQGWLVMAAAVLADLREAGELRTLEQVGFLRADRSMFVSASGPLRGTNPPDGWVSVYIVREDTTPTVPCDLCGGTGVAGEVDGYTIPCPRGCKPEGAVYIVREDNDGD